MAISNVNRSVTVTLSNTNYLNHPAIAGMDNKGFWYTYKPNTSANDSIATEVKPYKFGDALPLLNSAADMTIEGTLTLIDETWEGSTQKYHGGSIIHIGTGVNDITAVQETDALFFPHLGSLSPATDDDAFYWDRMFLANGTSEWEFYQYHKHLPTSYTNFENGRITFAADNFLNPADKAFGYMIHTRVRVSGNDFYSVLCRIHTPSIGGAHNSHNDVTMPTTANKNYMGCGIIKGVGDTYHAFYITANGSQWDVFNRTYTQNALSFAAEVNVGTYDLADPTFSPAALTGTQSQYPIRVSAGTTYGSRVYFPVIFNNATSGFDLRVWSFTSSNESLGSGSLLSQTLASGVSVRPDCHMTTVGGKLYVAYTDVANGGVSLYSYNGTAWTDEGQIVTNSTSNYVRVHGFRYNPEDVSFYVLLSGTAAGTGTTYAGPGLYSFDLGGGGFAGYKHLDYIREDNAFKVVNANTAGYLKHYEIDATIARINAVEPAGIPDDVNILKYELPNPVFYNREQLDFDNADEYYYNGIVLKDGRKLLVGRVGDDVGELGGSDFLITLRSDDNEDQYHFAWGGTGADYATGVFRSIQDPKKVWFTGYTKSELVPRKDIQAKNYIRNLNDRPSDIEWVDLIKDSNNNVYCIGNHQGGYGIVAKYDENYYLVWQKQFNDGAGTDVLYQIAVDESDALYIAGSTTNAGAGGTDAMVIKMTTEGAVTWARTYGTAGGTEVARGIVAVKKSTTEYIVVSVNSGTSTIFMALNTAGSIIEQNTLLNSNINRLRKNVSTPTGGRFLFAGSNAAATKDGLFGMGEVLGTRMIQWFRTFNPGGADDADFFDIQNIDAPNGSGVGAGYVICGRSETTQGSLLKVTVNESAGVYTVTKAWADLFGSEFRSIAVSPTTDVTRYIYAVGYTTASGIAVMGLDDGIITQWDNSGNLLWQNAMGHDMADRVTAVINDPTGNFIIWAGWSESHSTARDAVMGRAWITGLGTGTQSITGLNTSPYYYLKTALTATNDATAIVSQTAPTNSAASLASNAYNAQTTTATVYEDVQHDGAFGADGTFMFYVGIIDLDAIQTYLNGNEYRQNQANGIQLNYTDSIFTFYQAAATGDGSADDGNIFGYDIIETTNNSVGDGAGIVYAVGITSADLQITNAGTSGVYDYVVIEMDPVTGHMEFYQNGDATGKDEEVYACTELADGRIAYTGRTTGNLGDLTPDGGYDVFLGIFNRDTEISDYYSIGSGLDDKGVNVHDLGNNELIIYYTSYGSISGSTNFGSEDIGIIKFNYSTDTWGSTYQTGSSTSELVLQNGKPSVLLSNNKVAVVASTTGIFADDNETFGNLDVVLAILDLNTGTWSKYAVGSGANDRVQSIAKNGDRLIIIGHTEASFKTNGDAFTVEFDTQEGFKGITSTA